MRMITNHSDFSRGGEQSETTERSISSKDSLGTKLETVRSEIAIEPLSYSWPGIPKKTASVATFVYSGGYQPTPRHHYEVLYNDYITLVKCLRIRVCNPLRTGALGLALTINGTHRSLLFCTT